jgi:hypothetical protein
MRKSSVGAENIHYHNEELRHQVDNEKDNKHGNLWARLYWQYLAQGPNHQTTDLFD